ncbi:MAG: hypothetical protein IKN79_05260 [Eubacterium sp.]|nr:hypothetical protein [Eubacterium sp.]
MMLIMAAIPVEGSMITGFTTTKKSEAEEGLIYLMKKQTEYQRLRRTLSGLRSFYFALT